MQEKKHTRVRYRKSHGALKRKECGIVVVSESMVKKGATNLRPKIHVKRGDMVVLITGPRKEDKKRSPEDTRSLQERNAFKGTIGKVVKVLRSQGKVVVEGVNMVCHFVSAKKTQGQGGGIVRKEAPMHASKLMLWDQQNKKPVRASKRKNLA